MFTKIPVFKNINYLIFTIFIIAGISVTTLWFIPTNTVRNSSYLLEDAKAHPADQYKITAAIAHLETATSATPSDVQLQRMLAQAYLLGNQPEKAVVALEQAFRLAPDSLLVQQELAMAYEVTKTLRRASSLWQRISITPQHMVNIGDNYLQHQNYNEASRWYETAISYDSAIQPTLAFRQALISIITKTYMVDSYIQVAQNVDPNFKIHLVQGATRIKGKELRWLESFPEWDVEYGTPLASQPIGDFEPGILWWTGQSVLCIFIKEPGAYVFRIRIQHSIPPPVEIEIGLDGQLLEKISLGRADESWEDIVLSTNLTHGYHILHVGFLNNNVIDGKDRNALVAFIEITRE